MPTVASVTPANGAAAVQFDTPVRVELTRLDSTDYTKIETTQADFAAGTLAGTIARASNDLSLVFNSDAVDDFEADTVGAVPTGWDALINSDFVVASDSGSKWAQHAPASGRYSCLKWSLMGTAADVDIKVKWKATVSKLCEPSIFARSNGGATWADTTEYLAQCVTNSNQCILYKRMSGVTTQLGATISFTQALNTEYWLRFQVIGTALKVRVWAASGAEPGTWNLEQTDSSITASGWVGLHGYSTPTVLYDLFTMIGAGAQKYVSSGSRISPAYSLAGVGTFGTGIVQYDATIPANTSLTLKISKDGTNWTTVASGDHIALWAEGDSLAAASIYVKAELATSDTTVTPVLSEVRLLFMAQDPSLVEIDVDGVAFTLANGGLIAWNLVHYAAGPTLVDPYRKDVYFETVGRWWNGYGPHQVTVLVKYAGAILSTTTFGMDSVIAWGASGLEARWWASAIGGIYDGPMRATCWYFASKLEDYLVRGDAHWYVQFPPTSTADGWYLIAHAFRCDTPVAAIVGQPVTHEVPASGVGNCWARCDTPGMGIVQNWTRDDHSASGVVAVPMPPHDEALAAIVGQPLAKDTSASGVVYEVNANNGIDLRVISVEEAAFLAALGFTFR